MQLNDIAHVYVTVRDFAARLPFYEERLAPFEMKCLVKTGTLYYRVGSRGRSAQAIEPVITMRRAHR